MASPIYLLVFVILYQSCQSCSRPDTKCRMECIGEDSCKAAHLTCNPGYPCTVICDGKASCSDAVILGNYASELKVICDGVDACKSAWIECSANHQCSVNCKPGYNICDEISVITNSALSFECFNQCPAYVMKQVYTLQPTLTATTSSTTKTPTENPIYVTTTSLAPTNPPSNTVTLNPTNGPTINPAKNPLGPLPTNTTSPSTFNPTNIPTNIPTNTPTKLPTKNPTNVPTYNRSHDPTHQPTSNPVMTPTAILPQTQKPSSHSTSSTTRGPIANTTHMTAATQIPITTQMPTRTQMRMTTSIHTTTPMPITTQISTTRLSTSAPSVSETITRTTTTMNNIYTSNIYTSLPSLVPTAISSLHSTIKPTLTPTTKPSLTQTVEPTDGVYTTTNLSRETTIDENNCSSLHLLTPEPLESLTNIPTKRRSNISYGVVARLNFDYKFNSKDATNIVHIVTDIINTLVHGILPLKCADSVDLNAKYLRTLTDLIVDISIFVCDEQHEALKYVLDTNTNEILCHMLYVIGDDIDIQIPVNVTYLRTEAIMIFKEEIGSTSTPSPIIRRNTNNTYYYGRYGNNLQITLLVIAGTLAMTSIIILVFILILSSKKLRKKLKNPHSVSVNMEMEIESHKDANRIRMDSTIQYTDTTGSGTTLGSGDRERIYTISKGSPDSGYLPTIIIERTDKHFHSEGNLNETTDSMETTIDDICDVNGVWITRNYEVPPVDTDRYMLNHSVYDVGPSTTQAYELSPKHAVV